MVCLEMKYLGRVRSASSGGGGRALSCDLPLLDQVSRGFIVLQGCFSKGTALKSTHSLLHLPLFDTIPEAPT